MNYPVWDVAFGAGLLMALVAGLHVFISHFAVGGGLFLVLTERKARRNNDSQLLAWLKFHTRFFVLLTVVFGAVSGVGIWFTIGLISPTATSNLIHIYVWGWAIEWVFFFLEITAALLYLYGWDKLEPKVHEWFGWVYFIAAFASMVVINGIITFMLTPGQLDRDPPVLDRIFQSHLSPSLLFRFCISLALAGIYALITASVQRDAALKARIVRWGRCGLCHHFFFFPSSPGGISATFPPFFGPVRAGPCPPEPTLPCSPAFCLAGRSCLPSSPYYVPPRLHLAFSLVLAVVAFGAMDSFEFVRESVRKPFIITNYLYANSLYFAAMPGDGGFTVDNLSSTGVLQTAKWVQNRNLTPANQVAAGREIFRVECESCHTTNSYRGVHQYIVKRQWDQDKLHAMLGVLFMMHNNVMPQFAGTDAELNALSAYLGSLQPMHPHPDLHPDGRTVFEQNCSMCHLARPDDHLFTDMPKDPQAAVAALASLPAMFPIMPDLKLSEDERRALVQWVNTQRPTQAAKGGN